VSVVERLLLVSCKGLKIEFVIIWLLMTGQVSEISCLFLSRAGPVDLWSDALITD
jgi:hypothetical protein